MSVTYEPVTPQRADHLRTFFRPDHHPLQLHVSLHYPGTHIVPMPGADVFWDQLQQAVFCEPHVVLFLAGEARACHDNVAALAASGLLDAVVCGYGLSEDGLWRFHSWGERDGLVVETTLERQVYWGHRQPCERNPRRRFRGLPVFIARPAVT